MNQDALRELVKKELLLSIWLKISNLISKYSKLNISTFGSEITGHHSWLSTALNKGEDIRLSSLVRIFGQLSVELTEHENIPFEEIFTEKILQKALLLSQLTSNQESPAYLFTIIKEYEDIFKDIQNTLLPLYREGELNEKKLALVYEQLTEFLKETE